jgi:hypothetical protein
MPEIAHAATLPQLDGQGRRAAVVFDLERPDAFLPGAGGRLEQQIAEQHFLGRDLRDVDDGLALLGPAEEAQSLPPLPRKYALN